MYLIALLGICTLLGGSYCATCPEVSSSCQSFETWVCWYKEWAKNMEEWRLQKDSNACGASPGHSSTPGPNIEVNLTIYTSENSDTPAANATVVTYTGSFLIDVLDKAHDQSQITFQYELQKYGVYITSMMNVTADPDNREYWALLDSTGSFLPLGASCYQPDDGQDIVFRIKTY